MKACTAGKPGEVVVDVLVGLFVRDLKLFRQAVGAEPVDDPEVDSLPRVSTHRGRSPIPRPLAAPPPPSGGVDILTAGKDVLQDLFACDVSEDAGSTCE